VIRITKAGWIYILLTIFLGFSAVNTGNNLVYLVASALLSFMGISGFFSKGNLSKIDIEVEFPEEMFANTEAPIRIKLINNKRLMPAFLIRIKISDLAVLFPFANSKGFDSKHITKAFPARGEYRIENVHICSVFPFSFFRRCRRIKKDLSFIIFPHPKRCDAISVIHKHKSSGKEFQSTRTGYEPEVISVRDYKKTDPLKYISWKASAKTGELKTKEMSSSVQQPLIIDFEEVEIENLEEKISCVTYTILKMLKNNIPVGLRLNGKLLNPDISKQHKLKMLKELALYGKENKN